MESLVVALPGLFCAGGMAVMMWVMMRGQSTPARHGRDIEPAGGGSGLPSADEQVAQLRDELARLRAERDRPQQERID